MWKVGTPPIIHPVIVKATYDKLYSTVKNPAYKSVQSSSVQMVRPADK